MGKTLSLLIVGSAIYGGLGALVVMLLAGFAYNEFGILAPIGYVSSFALYVLLPAASAVLGSIKISVNE